MRATSLSRLAGTMAASQIKAFESLAGIRTGARICKSKISVGRDIFGIAFKNVRILSSLRKDEDEITQRWHSSPRQEGHLPSEKEDMDDVTRLEK